MTAEQFCNWLSGYLDIAAPREIREREILVIKDHLEEVRNPKVFLLQSEEVRKEINEANERRRKEGKPELYC
jgi:hypothetical protein